MNKTNNMNLWSIGLGSTLLMIMLAGSENAIGGGQASAVDSPRSGPSGFTMQVVQESPANGYGSVQNKETGTAGNRADLNKAINIEDPDNNAQHGISGNSHGNTDKLLAQVLTMVSDT